MEIRYPVVLIFIPLVLFLVFFFTKKKKAIYKEGSKIANTDLIMKTDYFKKKIREYNIIKNFVYVSFVAIIILLLLLISRPSKLDKKEINKYNRDIILCMDISASVDELNLELVDSLKDTVSKLHGERFGISIFNTSSVLLVPLTDDYDYITNTLDTIHKSLELNTSNNISDYNSVDGYFYLRDYIRSGTLEGNKERGSSLIGDGLASCVYSFSKKDSKRTKLIIFSTDNELEGTPLVSINEAAKISKKENIKVFGIGTKIMKAEARNELKDSVLLTGGKYYEHSSNTVNNIVRDIEKTSTSLLKSKTETKRYDIPEVPFILFLGFFALFIFYSKKVI